MIRRKMGPHLQNEPPKTDLQILEEVLNEQSSTSPYVSSLGTSSSISSGFIRKLEEELKNQEPESVPEYEKFKQQMEGRILAQEEQIEELKRMQKALEAAQKSSDDKTLAIEENHKEMEGILGFILSMSESSETYD
jgi:GrpB-like predicted nucleotidyltransferase (UPF0157 family)